MKLNIDKVTLGNLIGNGLQGHQAPVVKKRNQDLSARLSMEHSARDQRPETADQSSLSNVLRINSKSRF